MGHVDFQIDLPSRDSVWPGRSRSATATERRAFKRTLALGPAGAMICDRETQLRGGSLDGIPFGARKCQGHRGSTSQIFGGGAWERDDV